MRTPTCQVQPNSRRQPMLWLRALSGALVALLLSLGSPVHAQWLTEVRKDGGTWISAEETERKWPSLIIQQKLAVLDQLIGAGRADVALTLARRAAFPEPASEIVRRYYEAVALKLLGRTQEAIGLFRSILADHPEFVRVRMELAHALFIAQQDDSARHHFELLLGASGTNPGLEKTVRGFIATLDSRRRWQFSSYVSFAPSTNLNQGGTKREVVLNGLQFVLNDESLKRSGLGIVAGFQGGYRHPLTDTLDLMASAGAHVKRYKESDFNDTLLSASLGPRLRFGRGFIGVYGLAEKRLIADHDYFKSWGAMVSAGINLTPQDGLYVDVSCSRNDYDENWRGSSMDYRDGHTCGANGRYEHHFDSHTYLRVLAGAGRENTAIDHLDNRHVSYGAGLYRELPYGVSVYIQALHTKKTFKGLYPFFDEVRQDRRTDFSGHVVKRDFEVFGFAPMLQYTYTINHSNILLHDYDAHGASLTLTKSF